MKARKARLLAVHGFLGQPSDWDRLAADLPHVEVHAIDLWAALGDESVGDWPSAIVAVDAAMARGIASGRVPGPTFLVGYSLGARLVLGSRLLSSPGSGIRGCCFVSCHPGLVEGDGEGRAARRESDAAWAERLLTQPEDDLWEAWDRQPVFAGSRTPSRRGALPSSREGLARALTACSLAGQPDLRSDLCGWPTPVLWVTGGRDAKFAAIARGLEQEGVAAGFVTFEEAGHRVPWDNPPAFAAVLGDWIAHQL